MLKSFRNLHAGLAPIGGLVIICTAATQLSGCVVRAAVAVPAPPPPPRVYVAPPPPAPVVEAEVQASEPPPPLPQYEQPACPD
jgi:hypothetical protein